MLLYRISEVSKHRGLTIQIYTLKEPNQVTKTYLGSMCVQEESWSTVRGYLSGFVDETAYLEYKQAIQLSKNEKERLESEKRNKLLESLLAKYTPEQLAKLLEAK